MVHFLCYIYAKAYYANRNENKDSKIAFQKYINCTVLFDMYRMKHMYLNILKYNYVEECSFQNYFLTLVTLNIYKKRKSSMNMLLAKHLIIIIENF